MAIKYTNKTSKVCKRTGEFNKAPEVAMTPALYIAVTLQQDDKWGWCHSYLRGLFEFSNSYCKLLGALFVSYS